MFKKKFISALAACAAITIMSATAAFAETGAAVNLYPLCPVDGCELSELHQHDQDTYCGHYLNDGHAYHAACDRSDCDTLTVHEHDGRCYFGHCEISEDYAGSGCYMQENAGCRSAGRHHSGRRHHGQGHH